MRMIEESVVISLSWTTSECCSFTNTSVCAFRLTKISCEWKELV